MHITTILIIILVAAVLLGSIGYDVINGNYNINTLLTYFFVLLFTIVLTIDQECIADSSISTIAGVYQDTSRCKLWMWVKTIIIIVAIILYLIGRFKFFVKTDKNKEIKEEDTVSK